MKQLRTERRRQYASAIGVTRSRNVFPYFNVKGGLGTYSLTVTNMTRSLLTLSIQRTAFSAAVSRNSDRDRRIVEAKMPGEREIQLS